MFTKQAFNFIGVFLLLASVFAPAFSQEVFVCVWRNPERTMNRLFPDARDYKTVSLPISSSQLDIIEKRSQSIVLQGQREQYQYFEMLNDAGEIIGYTEAVTQKGDYGAIEFVFGLDKEYKVIGLYIQRSRERNNEFKAKDFLASFVGTSLADAEAIVDPLGDAGNTGTKAIANGLKKALITLDVLVLNK